MQYASYSTNMVKDQMASRCPGARALGYAFLPDFELHYQGFATIVPRVGSVVPVGLWEIDDNHLSRLDAYEGFPSYYRRESLIVPYYGETLIYIMNGVDPDGESRPSQYAADCTKQGYEDFDVEDLNKAEKEAAYAEGKEWIANYLQLSNSGAQERKAG